MRAAPTSPNAYRPGGSRSSGPRSRLAHHLRPRGFRCLTSPARSCSRARAAPLTDRSSCREGSHPDRGRTAAPSCDGRTGGSRFDCSRAWALLRGRSPERWWRGAGDPPARPSGDLRPCNGSGDCPGRTVSRCADAARPAKRLVRAGNTRHAICLARRRICCRHPRQEPSLRRKLRPARHFARPADTGWNGAQAYARGGPNTVLGLRRRHGLDRRDPAADCPAPPGGNR